MTRLIVVTGASAGIGKATALRFARNKDRVLMIARREDRLARATEEIRAEVPGADIEPLALDVSDPASVTALQERAAATGQAVSAVVCCAGAVPVQNAEGVESIVREWQDAHQANVMTAVITVEGLVPQLADEASIVLYSSIAAYRGSGGSGGYGAAKAALHSYVHTLSNRLGPRGISVNAVAPGYVADTDLFGGELPADRENTLVRQTLLGRAGDPADVAELSFYLCSRPGGYITSQIVQINGGASHGV
ncbi:SDR family NAD(P)-dependent oxidoreductase [Streptomyces sp. NBC_00388]|uniref:SDR family NAD(P)-dependent oxidoreductase n=1 Tax=Streptomyces sp. NBC_00388 TaxID=2975735 RepID=UPI002E23D59D